MTKAFTGLPRPDRNHLTLYVIGSGFGESSVIVLPMGGASRAPNIVVDTCMDGDAHLTLGLLDELGISRIDLLLVTHSDLDHVRGLPALFDRVKIVEAWRFPGAADVRTLASKWLRGRSTDRRLKELATAMCRLDELADANSCAEACADTRSWSPAAHAPSVTCLAPSQHDQRRSSRALDRLVRMEARGPKLAEEIANFLDRWSARLPTSYRLPRRLSGLPPIYGSSLGATSSAAMDPTARGGAAS
jgi:Metallo-beta-lactamase superfamily